MTNFFAGVAVLMTWRQVFIGLSLGLISSRQCELRNYMKYQLQKKNTIRGIKRSDRLTCVVMGASMMSM